MKIIVADDEPSMLAFYRKALPELGFDVIGMAETGRDLMAQCERLAPELVITDIEMPEMTGLEVAEAVAAGMHIPVIIVSSHHADEMVRRSESAHAMAYLVKPLSRAQLKPTIMLALGRFRELELLRCASARLQQNMEEQSVIDRAVTVLMTNIFLEEEAATNRLRHMALEKNKTVVEIARSIVAMQQAQNGHLETAGRAEHVARTSTDQ